MLKTLIRRWRYWRLAPGLKWAAKEAERRAWGHPNAASLEPERNLLTLSHYLTGYELDLEDGGYPQPDWLKE